MRKEFLTATASTTYVWLTIIVFGAIAAETVILYPNIFHDVPSSLELAGEFFAVAGPGSFFPPLGAATLAVGAGSLLALWRHRIPRWWTAASLAVMVVGEYLYSAVYFWPRNKIMFDEGPAVHSADVLRRTATEFEIGHWGRLTMSAVTAVLAFIAFLRYRREAGR